MPRPRRLNSMLRASAMSADCPSMSEVLRSFLNCETMLRSHRIISSLDDVDSSSLVLTNVTTVQPYRFHHYTASQKTILMLHILAEMLLREYAIKLWFVVPPLLTNVSALPGETWTWTPKIVFSVMLYTVSRKPHCFGLLYLRHASTNVNQIVHPEIKTF